MAFQILMSKRIKLRPFYESSLYIGSFDNTSKCTFIQENLFDCISEFQDFYETMIPVRVSPTTFLSGSDYRENGWKISAIDYPPLDIDADRINDFITSLANYLLEHFSQHRVSVVASGNILTIENKDRSNNSEA